MLVTTTQDTLVCLPVWCLVIRNRSLGTFLSWPSSLSRHRCWRTTFRQNRLWTPDGETGKMSRSCLSGMDNETPFFEIKPYRGAALAQWILSAPNHPAALGLSPKHTIYAFIITVNLCYICRVKSTKINIKRPDVTHLKNLSIGVAYCLESDQCLQHTHVPDP